jgi:hypothetical protein
VLVGSAVSSVEFFDATPHCFTVLVQLINFFYDTDRSYANQWHSWNLHTV